jgi:hypothetical protein
MSVDGGSFARLSFHVGADWRIYCHSYADTTPILDIDAGASSVAFSVRGRDADKAAVEFARALACEAQKFADEMERKLTALPGGDNKAADSNAA